MTQGEQATATQSPTDFQDRTLSCPLAFSTFSFFFLLSSNRDRSFVLEREEEEEEEEEASFDHPEMHGDG